jgi:hypothetical protein
VDPAEADAERGQQHEGECEEHAREREDRTIRWQRHELDLVGLVRRTVSAARPFSGAGSILQPEGPRDLCGSEAIEVFRNFDLAGEESEAPGLAALRGFQRDHLGDRPTRPRDHERFAPPHAFQELRPLDPGLVDVDDLHAPALLHERT